MARHRTPTAVLELQGTARKDRHASRTDAQFTPQQLAAPAWLKGEGLAMWHQLTEHEVYQRAINGLDLSMLAVFCSMWDQFVETQTNRKAKPMNANQLSVFVNLGSKLGLNPSDRAKIKLPEAPKPANKFEVLRQTGS